MKQPVQVFEPCIFLSDRQTRLNNKTDMSEPPTKAVPPAQKHDKKMNVDLEDAMDMAGAGRYQVFHCVLMISCLCSALLELISYQFILPAAACDLDLPTNIRGLIASIPNIGIILTAPFWGRAADHFGRKPILMISSAACGLINILAAFMPNLISFGLCKLFGALFISCPTSLAFAYAGEMAPRRRRDLAVLVCNGFLTLSAAFSPLFAWAVLSADWQFYMGSVLVRPWRLLSVVYALPLVLTAAWMTRAKESPKFLMTKGRKEDALEVLRHVYAVNTGRPKEKYDRDETKTHPQHAGLEEKEKYIVLQLLLFHRMRVASLKRCTEGLMESRNGSSSDVSVKVKEESAWALLRPPHVKWFTLISFLMFGLYTSLNGLFLFATDTINKVLGETEQNGTLCAVMNQPGNETTTGCVDSISQETFIIMVVTTTVYGVLVLAASVVPLGKKTLLLGMYLVCAATCLLAVLITNMVVAGVAFSALQISALGIGPLTAYAVELFPTSLRGCAVGAVLMWGRVGSVVGANLAGYMLAAACAPTFYGFGALLLACAGLSFLLPKEPEPHRPRRINNNNDR